MGWTWRCLAIVGRSIPSGFRLSSPLAAEAPREHLSGTAVGGVPRPRGVCPGKGLVDKRTALSLAANSPCGRSPRAICLQPAPLPPMAAASRCEHSLREFPAMVAKPMRSQLGECNLPGHPCRREPDVSTHIRSLLPVGPSFWVPMAAASRCEHSLREFAVTVFFLMRNQLGRHAVGALPRQSRKRESAHFGSLLPAGTPRGGARSAAVALLAEEGPEHGGTVACRTWRGRLARKAVAHPILSRWIPRRGCRGSGQRCPDVGKPVPRVHTERVFRRGR